MTNLAFVAVTYISFFYLIFGLNIKIKYHVKMKSAINKQYNRNQNHPYYINRHTIHWNQINQQETETSSSSSSSLPLLTTTFVDDDDESSSIVRRLESIISVFFNNNPIYRAIANLYSFFYWFPRKNLPYDKPWMIFKNSTTEWLQWNQFPHNLPPYNYLGEDHPKDFFCWGLPGNTWPLGNWDPFAMQLVSPKVVKKYRESELKHGRLAMLATIGLLVQEVYHPIYASHISGLAITHMAQLRELDPNQSLIYRFILQPFCNSLSINTIDVSILNQVSLDYYLLLTIFMATEAYMLKRNWSRWARDEYNHQYDHNIGIGNLKHSYENGDYGFDPLHLFPKNKIDRQYIIEAELNHCRLAMIAAIGMIGQEYLTGLPLLSSLSELLSTTSIDGAISSNSILDPSITSDIIQQSTSSSSTNSIFESISNLIQSISKSINSAFESSLPTPRTTI